MSELDAVVAVLGQHAGAQAAEGRFLLAGALHMGGQAIVTLRSQLETAEKTIAELRAPPIPAEPTP